MKSESEYNIIIIPNPANNKIEIKLIGLRNGICKIRITDALGSEVLSKKLTCELMNKHIDVSNLKQGVYSINVDVNDNYRMNSKLVIVRWKLHF